MMPGSKRTWRAGSGTREGERGKSEPGILMEGRRLRARGRGGGEGDGDGDCEWSETISGGSSGTGVVGLVRLKLGFARNGERFRLSPCRDGISYTI